MQRENSDGPSGTPVAGPSGTPAAPTHHRQVENIFQQYSSDSDNMSSDGYDTDDSNTFGLEVPDQYPIRSVTLQTEGLYRSTNPGVVNSSPIDQWITAIILQFNRRKTKNLALFRHQRGEGKELEEIIQEIAIIADLNQKLWWKPVEGDNRLKCRWIELVKMAVKIDDDTRFRINGGERTNVFHHLKSIALFKERIGCHCRRNDKEKSHHYLRIRSKRDIEKVLSNKVPITSYGGLRHCRKCCQPFSGNSIAVPDTTWILVHELDDIPGNVVYNDFQRKIRFGGVNWNLTYISFAGPAVRTNDPLYISLQFIGNRAFYYNGDRNSGYVKPFTDDRLFRHSKMERAVYFRQV